MAPRRVRKCHESGGAWRVGPLGGCPASRRVASRRVPPSRVAFTQSPCPRLAGLAALGCLRLTDPAWPGISGVALSAVTWRGRPEAPLQQSSASSRTHVTHDKTALSYFEPRRRSDVVARRHQADTPTGPESERHVLQCGQSARASARASALSPPAPPRPRCPACSAARRPFSHSRVLRGGPRRDAPRGVGWALQALPNGPPHFLRPPRPPRPARTPRGRAKRRRLDGPSSLSRPSREKGQGQNGVS